MSINIHSLKAALINLPIPEHADQRMRISLPSRVTELNCLYHHDVKREDIKAEVSEYMLVAKQYCRSRNDCWLEWELDV